MSSGTKQLPRMHSNLIYLPLLLSLLGVFGRQQQTVTPFFVSKKHRMEHNQSPPRTVRLTPNALSLLLPPHRAEILAGSSSALQQSPTDASSSTCPSTAVPQHHQDRVRTLVNIIDMPSWSSPSVLPSRAELHEGVYAVQCPNGNTLFIFSHL